MWKEQAHPFQTQKPLKSQLKSHTARFQQSVQDGLKYVADVDKNVTTTINEDEIFDETDSFRGVIQVKTEVWNIKSKLDLGKKWGEVFGFSGGGREVKIFLVKMCYYLRGGADKSLAQQGRKQATATKLGIYSTYIPRSSVYFLARCSNFCKPLREIRMVFHPTRSPRQQ